MHIAITPTRIALLIHASHGHLLSDSPLHLFDIEANISKALADQQNQKPSSANKQDSVVTVVPMVPAGVTPVDAKEAAPGPRRRAGVAPGAHPPPSPPVPVGGYGQRQSTLEQEPPNTSSSWDPKPSFGTVSIETNARDADPRRDAVDDKDNKEDKHAGHALWNLRQHETANRQRSRECDQRGSRDTEADRDRDRGTQGQRHTPRSRSTSNHDRLDDKVASHHRHRHRARSPAGDKKRPRQASASSHSNTPVPPMPPPGIMMGMMM